MRKDFMASNKVGLSDVRESKGNTTHVIMAKMQVEGYMQKFNITYDVLADNVVIHEWYRFQDNDLVAVLSELLKATFREELAR